MKRISFFFLLAILANGAFAQQQMRVKKNDYTTFAEEQTSITPELIQLTPAAFQSHPDFGIPPVNTPDGYIELIQRRTLDSRYYIKNNSGGDEFAIQKSAGAINYYDADGNLRAMDFSLHQTSTPGIYAAAAQPLPTKIDFVNGYTSLTVKDFEFRYNSNLKLTWQKGNTFSAPELFKTAEYTAGRDGAFIKNIFNGIDGEIAIGKGTIKTNFIIRNASVVDPSSDYMIIEEFIALPDKYRLVADEEKGAWIHPGAWRGDMVLKNEFGLDLLRIERPIILDQQKIKQHPQEQIDAIFYEVIKQEGGYLFRIKISTKWLAAPERLYPIIIDPTLIGEATYTGGDIGFEFDNLCFNDLEYCDYFLDITVPGKTTLTAAYFDGTYYSQILGCGAYDCIMKEAAFRIIGPCDDSPFAGGLWTCLPPEGDTAGTCYGIDLDMFNTIACIPPQCADYEFTFEMRTFMCSCTKPTCSITCHYMPDDSWVITIEGKTVEENPIQSDLFPDFVICEGDSIDLFASGIWGVPPYIYEWIPGGAIEDIHVVAPTTSTTYTSVIHDVCDMTDTVSQLVTVNPSPVIQAGPFEGCYETTLTVPAGYSTYVWTTADSTIIATGTNSILVDSAGFYYVTVVDANGCEGTSDPIQAIINVAPVVNAFPDTVYVNDGALGQLNVETISGDDVSYLWFPPEDISCPTCATTLVYSVGEQNTYYVTGEENGCISDPDSVIVVMSESELIIPNAFTPNADGLNDVFHILNPIFYPEFSFSIYNRWGQEVFSTNDVLQGWDGTFEDITQEIGMYIWMVNYEKANQPGYVFTLKGTVTLLR